MLHLFGDLHLWFIAFVLEQPFFSLKSSFSRFQQIDPLVDLNLSEIKLITEQLHSLFQGLDNVIVVERLAHTFHAEQFGWTGKAHEATFLQRMIHTTLFDGQTWHRAIPLGVEVSCWGCYVVNGLLLWEHCGLFTTLLFSLLLQRELTDSLWLVHRLFEISRAHLASLFDGVQSIIDELSNCEFDGL